jgi:hypothetical protein
MRESMSDPNLDPKLANAEAKAAKAKAKALRPWFKKKRFIAPIALVVIIGLSTAANGGKSPGSTDNGSNTNNTEEQPAMPGVGDAAVDGKFSFTVKSVKCGIKSVGTKYLNKKPQGQFCKLSLDIENVGDEPQTMFADNQKLLDAEDREFSPDTSAMIYMGDDANTWLEEINPGNTLEGFLLFDIPADAAPSKIELHDSAFSGGVTVSLK